MTFEWDDAKNRANIRKHGFDFADAEEMFRGLLLVDPDTREDYGERRWIGLGSIRGRIAHMVFTEPSPDTVRIISLRKASRYESETIRKGDPGPTGSGLTRFGTRTLIFQKFPNTVLISSLER